VAFSIGALLLVATVVAWAAPGAGNGRVHAEAQSYVVSEGMTADEHLRAQADLSRWLASELPARAAEAVRVPLSREEIAGIERSPRSKTPLQIGLVKPMAPGIELFGLTRGAGNGQARRGVTGVATPTPDGGFVWATAVVSENAGAIRLHVENLSLPRNAALYIYARDGQAFGPYTAEADLWAGTIFGTEAIVQVRLAAPVTEADLSGVSLRIAEAGLITPGFASGLGLTPEAPPPPGWPCGNANCLVDASCQNTQLKLAVAKMEWIQGAFIYTCTGGLIADSNPSQNDFFLTANHCVSKNNNAQNVNFYWRFATSSCNGSSCPNNSGWPYQTSGSTVSKTGRKGDFTLLHLNTPPPSGSVVLGYTTAPVANSNGTDLFRVSNPNFGPQVYSQHRVDTAVGTCSGWPRGERIYSRDIVGAIDGGSSGSPITNGSLQIVGQLSGICGTNVNDVCAAGPGEANATVDGAFAFYYSLVQPILAP
jgi:hypothetical protein